MGKLKINISTFILAIMVFCRCDCSKPFLHKSIEKSNENHPRPKDNNESENVKNYQRLYERSLTQEIKNFKDKKTSAELTQEDVDKMGTEGFIALRIAEGMPNWRVLYEEYKKNPNLKMNYIEMTDEFIAQKLPAGIYYVNQRDRADQVIKIANSKEAGQDIDELKGDLYADYKHSRYVNTQPDSDTNFADIDELLLLMKLELSMPSDIDFFNDLDRSKNLFGGSFDSESAFNEAALTPGIYFIKSDDSDFEIKKIIKLNSNKSAGESAKNGDYYWDRDVYIAPNNHWLRI